MRGKNSFTRIITDITVYSLKSGIPVTDKYTAAGIYNKQRKERWKGTMHMNLSKSILKDSKYFCRLN